MWATGLNSRGYSFLEAPTGTSFGRVSVVKGAPGKAAMSAVWYDADRSKLRSRFLGQHGAAFASKAVSYAADHPASTAPAVVVVVDSEGTVIYSIDLVI